MTTKQNVAQQDVQAIMAETPAEDEEMEDWAAEVEENDRIVKREVQSDDPDSEMDENMKCDELPLEKEYGRVDTENLEEGDIMTQVGADGRHFCKTKPKLALPIGAAIDILSNFETYLTPADTDLHPQGGDIYVFDKERVERKVWRCDGFSWRNNGSSLQPKSNPHLRKIFYIVRSKQKPEGDRAFQKTIYFLIRNPSVILIHYMGDASIAPGTTKQKLHKQMASAPKRKQPLSDDLRERGLTIEEVVETLENYEEHLSMSRAVRPKGGEIYLFDRNAIGEDWKCDGYIWRNSGTRYMPSKNPVMRKNFYFIRTLQSGDKGSKEFKKAACYLLKRPNIVLVHYMGDETVFTPRKHGNRKKGDVEFVRTCPSVLQAIKNVVVKEDPIETFNRFMTAEGEKPRDIKQILSLKERLTRSSRKRTERKNSDVVMEQKVVTIIHQAEENPTEDVSQVIFDESMTNLEEVDINKLSDENLKPMLMEPLDTHPGIREVQLQILQQQKRNLKLQEEKLQLEIVKLEKQKKLKKTSSNPSVVVQSNQETMDAGVHGVPEGANVIYVNDANELMQFTNGSFGDREFVYVDESGEILQPVYEQQYVTE